MMLRIYSGLLDADTEWLDVNADSLSAGGARTLAWPFFLYQCFATPKLRQPSWFGSANLSCQMMQKVAEEPRN
ncbi:hypothetical protein ACLKA7_003105 [Drosophila subpalustris]